MGLIHLLRVARRTARRRHLQDQDVRLELFHV
jgi:hypothetical protein